MAEAQYSAARLLASTDLGGGLSLLTIEIQPAVARSHVLPGQYIEVRVGQETGYFVLAGEPGARTWDLIMKSGGGASDVLLVMPPGGRLEVTEAIGAGFPMDTARGRTLVVVLGGSGVAAGRPLLARRMADGDAARTAVFIALRRREEVAMESDIDAWERAGARVFVCLSQDEAAGGGPRFVRGRIQDVLRSFATATPSSFVRALAFAVGPQAMVDSVREVAPELGLRPEDVLTNH